jgi:hypothetical protein
MRRMIVAVAVCLLAGPAVAQTVPGTLPEHPAFESNFLGFSGPPSPTDAWVTFPQAGVSLGPNGEVKIESSKSLTETAKQFWNAVAMVRGQKAPFQEIAQ